MFANLCRLLRDKLHLPAEKWTPQVDTTLKEPRATVLIPGARVRYLAEIAEQGRGINSASTSRPRSPIARRRCWQALHELGDAQATRATQRLCHGRPEWRCRCFAAEAAPALQRRREGADFGLAQRAARMAGAAQGHHRSALSLRSARQAGRGQQLRRVDVAPEDTEDRRADVQELGRTAHLPEKGKPAGRVSVHRRRLSVSPHRRGPAAHVRGRGHARAHEPALPLSVAGTEVHASVDRVRFGHAVRRRPASAPGHLRQDRQLGCQRRRRSTT